MCEFVPNDYPFANYVPGAIITPLMSSTNTCTYVPVRSKVIKIMKLEIAVSLLLTLLVWLLSRLVPGTYICGAALSQKAMQITPKEAQL